MWTLWVKPGQSMQKAWPTARMWLDCDMNEPNAEYENKNATRMCKIQSRYD